jgi:hypothetical protein
MTERVRGVKAGLISMPIYGAALWMLTLAAASIHGFDLSESMVDILGLYPVPIVSLQGFLWTVIDPGITFGIIYGLAFAGMYRKLPGKSSSMKGTIFGVVAWIILGVIARTTGGRVVILGDPLFLFPTYLIVGFIAAILFGALLGFLWDKFAPSSKSSKKETK